ncbi:MAG: hypothetical protein ABI769_15960 [Pseudomonadota bacterium]
MKLRLIASYAVFGPPIGLAVVAVFAIAADPAGADLTAGTWNGSAFALVSAEIFGLVPALAAGGAHLLALKLELARRRLLTATSTVGVLIALANFSALLPETWIDKPTVMIAVAMAAMTAALCIGGYLTRAVVKSPIDD